MRTHGSSHDSSYVSNSVFPSKTIRFFANSSRKTFDSALGGYRGRLEVLRLSDLLKARADRVGLVPINRRLLSYCSAETFDIVDAQQLTPPCFTFCTQLCYNNYISSLIIFAHRFKHSQIRLRYVTSIIVLCKTITSKFK